MKEKCESDELKGTAAQFKRTAPEPDREPPVALPRLMLVTLRESMQPTFADALEAALRGGARLIQLREPGDVSDEIRERAAITAELCARFSALWLWNGDEAMAREVGADGVHWPERMIPAVASPATESFLRGASVHSIEAARRAADAGAHYLVFGSVWETASHPGGQAAGLDLLRTVCDVSSVPVYAIGGVTAGRVTDCHAAGAYGVAVMRAVWEADDVEAAAREFASAL